MNNTQIVTILVGPPASGKSTWARGYVEENPNTEIVSSDAIRERIFAEDMDQAQSDNQRVFRIFREEATAHLKAGKDVILDATSMSKKRRRSTINELRKATKRDGIILEFHAKVFAEFIEHLVANDRKRKHPVGYDNIIKLLKGFSMPTEEEGFSTINIMYTDEYYELCTAPEYADFIGKQMKGFDQDNPHHNEDLLEHTVGVMKRVPAYLGDAAFMHDAGKLHTKTYVNMDGTPSLHARYFGHANVSAYMSLWLLLGDDPGVHTHWIIANHMIDLEKATKFVKNADPVGIAALREFQEADRYRE